jgi:hypothetical protein
VGHLASFLLAAAAFLLATSALVRRHDRAGARAVLARQVAAGLLTARIARRLPIDVLEAAVAGVAVATLLGIAHPLPVGLALVLFGGAFLVHVVGVVRATAAGRPLPCGCFDHDRPAGTFSLVPPLVLVAAGTVTLLGADLQVDVTSVAWMANGASAAVVILLAELAVGQRHRPLATVGDPA